MSSRSARSFIDRREGNSCRWRQRQSTVAAISNRGTSCKDCRRGGAGGDNGLHEWLFICFYHDAFGESGTYCGRALGVGDHTQTILNLISFNIDRQFEIGSHRRAQPLACKTFQSPRCLMDMADATATLLNHKSRLSMLRDVVCVVIKLLHSNVGQVSSW
jgi:hypothetical protein